MKKKYKNINQSLWNALKNSPFNKIDYETLIAQNPSKIREEENQLSLGDEPLEIPSKLDVENIYVPSRENLREIRLRLYKPKSSPNKAILLYFHGGAFIYGTPEQYDFIFYRLALETNMLIVSVDYRLAPEHPFPAAIEDGYDVLAWLSNNGEKIGGNKNKIIISGSSAGATIAASITHLSRDRNEINLLHQFLIYPAMSHLLESESMQKLDNAPMQTKSAARWMWKHYLQDHEHKPLKYSVPLCEDNFKNLPNATIITCEFDPLKDEAVLYANKLKESNILVDLIEIKGAVHAFDFFESTLSEDFYTKQVALLKAIIK